MIRGIFIGQDGSMGFEYGKEYQFYTWIENNYLFLKTSEGLWCPYSNLEKLLDNWKIVDGSLGMKYKIELHK